MGVLKHVSHEEMGRLGQAHMLQPAESGPDVTGLHLRWENGLRLVVPAGSACPAAGLTCA